MERGIVLLVCAVVALFGVVYARAQWIEGKLDAVRRPLRPVQTQSRACQGVSKRPILIVGDSRVSRWPMALFADARVMNRGVAGETASQMAARFEEDVLARCPGILVIESGINDLVAASLTNRTEARQIVDQLTRILIDLAEQGADTGAQVYLATIIPPGQPDPLRRLVWSWTILDRLEEVNDALRAHVWRRPVFLIDFAARLDPESVGVLRHQFRSDTLHLSDAAYAELMVLLPFVTRR